MAITQKDNAEWTRQLWKACLKNRCGVITRWQVWIWFWKNSNVFVVLERSKTKTKKKESATSWCYLHKSSPHSLNKQSNWLITAIYMVWKTQMVCVSYVCLLSVSMRFKKCQNRMSSFISKYNSKYQSWMSKFAPKMLLRTKQTRPDMFVQINALFSPVGQFFFVFFNQLCPRIGTKRSFF